MISWRKPHNLNAGMVPVLKEQNTAVRPITRRGFIIGGTALAAHPPLHGARLPVLDDNLVLLISDCHVAAKGADFAYKRLQRCVERTLALNPLPRRAFMFGDIAGTVGPRADYERSAKLFHLLEKAGIEVSYMMGNHDRRAGFLEVHPECAVKSPVPNRLVQVVETPQCDFVMLDSLIGEDGDDKIVVRGALDHVQAEWLEAELAKRTKPVIICAHHSCDELQLNSGKSLSRVLPYMPQVRGYIYGHVHRWSVEWKRRFDGDGRFMRALSLPATGNWGDLGYCLMRFTDRQMAEVRLFQDDYCYPRPAEPGKRPRCWDMVVSDNRDSCCTFDLG